MKPLVISEAAINVLGYTQLPPEWFLEPGPLSEVPINVHEGTDGIYVSTPNFGPTDRLVVIARTDDGLFGGVPEIERRGVFDRCRRLALHGFGESVAINPKWMPYHQGNKLSIFAYGIGHRERIVAEINCQNEGHVFICAFGTTFQNLAKLKPDYNLYDKAVTGYLEVGPVDARPTAPAGTIDLGTIEQTAISQGFSYADWYPLRLTRDQLKFVDYKLAGPLRLRGGAGTGKTLAMAIKALKSKYEADSEGRSARILFLTHSWAIAEQVDRLITALDENPGGASTIDVFPLLSLAEGRNYAEIGRRPLGIDSDDGKKLALLEISDVVDDFLNGDWPAYQASCTYEFKVRIEFPAKTMDRRLLCWDLLIEFGCVIAAQGLLTRADDKERYLRIRRQKWMMPLDAVADREVAFALWTLFMERLKERGLIPTDQIVSDYLNDLGTFYWEAARAERGYDIIFVDETHLFNSQERMVFHNLLRNGDDAPTVVMALDPNQSPRETYTNVVIDGETSQKSIYERARLPNPEKIDLKDVFRYTPQIGAVIGAIAEAAPGLDLPEDWDTPVGASVTADGPVPRYFVVSDDLQSFRIAIRLAFDLARDVRSRSGRVAILCMEGPRFETFRKAASGQFRNDAFVIASRDDVDAIQYAGKKFIFSTPEYVAGLQFDTVILIDVNKNKVPEGRYYGFHLRRFLSELYLGMGRAQRDLIIVASKDEGGLSPVLKKAMTQGAIVEGKI